MYEAVTALGLTGLSMNHLLSIYKGLSCIERRESVSRDSCLGHWRLRGMTRKNVWPGFCIHGQRNSLEKTPPHSENVLPFERETLTQGHCLLQRSVSFHMVDVLRLAAASEVMCVTVETISLPRLGASSLTHECSRGCIMLD